MPIDTVGEVVVAAFEAVGDIALTEPPKRGRWRRFVYWSLLVLFFGLLAFGAYLFLS
jgi:hypothetical protein